LTYIVIEVGIDQQKEGWLYLGQSILAAGGDEAKLKKLKDGGS